MLWRAMCIARRAMRSASATRPMSSARITTSAASAVMPPPCAASAIPTVAVPSAGASFVPSPTMSTGCPLEPKAFTSRTLSAGSRSPCASVIPTSRATFSTFGVWSPESSTVRRTPSVARSAKSAFSSGRTRSAYSIAPAALPSIAT